MSTCSRECARIAAILFTAVLAACATTAPRTGSVPAAPPVKDISVALESAKSAVADNDLAAAEAIVTRALAAKPDDAAALMLLGDVHLRNGDYAQAVEVYGKVHGEHRASALHRRGIAFFRMGRHIDAREELSTAVAQDPALWAAWTALGQVNDTLQDWGASERAYEQAIILKPDSAEIHNSLGVSRLAQRRFAEARQSFLAALERNPGQLEAQGNLRIAYAWGGDYERALADTANAERVQVLNNIGYVAMARGDYSQAESLLSEALRISPVFYKRAADNLEELRRRSRPAEASER